MARGGRVAPTKAGGSAAPADPSLQYLLGRLGLVEERVRNEIARRREVNGLADDQFLGLYVSDEHVDRLLAGPGPTPLDLEAAAAGRVARLDEQAAVAESAGADVRLRRLARAWDLTELDVELLLVAAAPSFDARFEPLYGYLNDDVSLRHATVGMALRLCGVEPTSAVARARLGSEGPLVRGGLVWVDDARRPQLTRSLRVPDRVVAHLLGDDTLDPQVALLRTPDLPVEGPTSASLARGLEAGAKLVYVRDAIGAGGASAAAAALVTTGAAPLSLDLERLTPETELTEVAAAAVRDARLLGAGLVVGPIEVLTDRGPSAVRAFAETDATVVLVGRGPWDPRWSRQVPVVVHAVRVPDDDHDRLWLATLGDDLTPDLEPGRSTAPFRLTPQQIVRAAQAARQQAAVGGHPVAVADLHDGIRAQNAAGLERLARRVDPSATWDDIVVPSSVETQLRELPLRWRHRDQVMEEWQLGRGTSRGRGVSALFAGASGTGKTLAAEVIAADLGLDLYVVDLSTVIDKYIGETSKNLERIFDEADRVNGVLLFDEADALFGKRSAVSDAKDRHANVEVAFLLQRMERFDGVAVLTTNLASNLDQAFLRRLDAIVDFPTPDESLRRALWEAKLGTAVPRSDDVDIDELARLFTMSGSEIRNVVVGAAYHAAARGGEVTMVDLVRAVVREHAKMGRRLTAVDLGGYAYLLEPGR